MRGFRVTHVHVRSYHQIANRSLHAQEHVSYVGGVPQRITRRLRKGSIAIGEMWIDDSVTDTRSEVLSETLKLAVERVFNSAIT